MKKRKVHKELLFTLIYLLIIVPAYSQDLTGYWQGQFRTDQRLNGRSQSFFMNMVLKQTGKKVEGRFGNAPLDFPNSPQVVYEISGIIGKKDKIPTRLRREQVLYTRLWDEVADFFLELDDIRYLKNDTMEMLYGNWMANGLPPLRSDGAAGSFWVKKLTRKDSLQKSPIAADSIIPFHSNEIDITKPDALLIPEQMAKRKNIEEGNIIVNTRNITLQVYDNGIVDGDSVSIFLNGVLLLSHRQLSEKPIVINIDLAENVSRNELILFAENMGTVPPNTALIVVTAGDKRYELFSKASLEENAVLIFEYKPK